jgi:hypothetical protein
MTFEFVIAALFFIILAMFIYLTVKNMNEVKRLREMAKQPSIDILDLDKTELGIERLDFTIKNDLGKSVVECYEIARFPKKSVEIVLGSELAKRSTHLISDFVKGGIGLPNKTVEIVFKPEIAAGLKDGTYVMMKTTDGEVLADAVDAVGKKIVGKGRIVEGGRIKQISVGAYNLLGIAVAQSHLANIERSLGDIKGQLKNIQNKLNTNDYAEIKGAIDYYAEINNKIRQHHSPDDLSAHIANNIELIHKDSHTWRCKIFKEFSDLNNRIRDLKDLDTFGTENTAKRLRELMNELDPISERYSLLLQLSLISKAVLYYADPSSLRFTPIKVDLDSWNELVTEYEKRVHAKANEVLSKAVFNDSSTLEDRKRNVLLQAKLNRIEILQQTNWFLDSSVKLDNQMNSLLDAGEFKLALEFDSKGEVSKSAVLA